MGRECTLLVARLCLQVLKAVAKAERVADSVAEKMYRQLLGTVVFAGSCCRFACGSMRDHPGP